MVFYKIKTLVSRLQIAGSTAGSSGFQHLQHFHTSSPSMMMKLYIGVLLTSEWYVAMEGMDNTCNDSSWCVLQQCVVPPAGYCAVFFLSNPEAC